jgi:DNA topoisomerase VI subunit A
MLEESSEYDMEKNDSKLNDSDYSEADKVKTDDYYGDKYNTSFVQELLKLRKEKEKDNE